MKKKSNHTVPGRASGRDSVPGTGTNGLVPRHGLFSPVSGRAIFPVLRAGPLGMAQMASYTCKLSSSLSLYFLMIRKIEKTKIK